MTGDTMCPIHGDYSDHTGMSVRRECPGCAREAQRVEVEWKQSWGAYTWWRGHAGIPRRYRNRTVKNWRPDGQDESAVELVTRYAETITKRVEAGDGINLIGPVGIGKTHLLCGSTSAACKVHICALYTVWPDLIETHRQSIKAQQDDPRRRALEDAAMTPLLCLDEIGLGSGSAWEQQQLFELVDFRYREKLATCIASNTTAAGLAEVVGERLSDRLQEMNATAILRGNSNRGLIQINDGPAMNPPTDRITVTECKDGVLCERTIEREPPTTYGR